MTIYHAQGRRPDGVVRVTWLWCRKSLGEHEFEPGHGHLMTKKLCLSYQQDQETIRWRKARDGFHLSYAVPKI